MIELAERPDVPPICPHCEKTLKTINFQVLSAWLGRRYVYFCGACRKVLGVSHRKGFWMG